MKSAQKEQTLRVVKEGQTPRFYSFAPFLIDNRKHVLLRDGESVSLTPKAFETLLVLIEAGGQVVEKDELMKRIWPDQVFSTCGASASIRARGSRRARPFA
jgi:DNA-binding response OmpR family regulator